jgi:ATP-dependent Clp protease adaptor protein ClpS
MPEPTQPGGGDAGTVTRTKTGKKLAPPPMFKVLLHNDDYTTMEFVVSILESVFGHSTPAATRIMLSVHHRGVGVAGVFPREIAESKAQKAMSLARASEFPLLATIEAE